MNNSSQQGSRGLKLSQSTKTRRQRNQSYVLDCDMENALWALKHYVHLLLNDGGAERDSAYRYLLSLRALVPPQRHEEFGIVDLARQYEEVYGEEHEPGDVPNDPAEVAQWLDHMRGGQA